MIDASVVSQTFPRTVVKWLIPGRAQIHSIRALDTAFCREGRLRISLIGGTRPDRQTQEIGINQRSLYGMDQLDVSPRRQHPMLSLER